MHWIKRRFTRFVLIAVAVFLMAQMGAGTAQSGGELLRANVTGPDRIGSSKSIGTFFRDMPIGVWGGKHIRLEVTVDGGVVELDCAHGSISQRIVVNRNGNFVVDGDLVAEHGGPVRADEQASHLPVRFNGRVSGKSLELTIRRHPSRKLVGTFTLVFGEEGELAKCR